jgi:hypothetical protein
MLYLKRALTPVSRGVRLTSALCLWCGYFAVKFLFQQYLPEKLFIDSERIFDSGESINDVSNSFTTTASFFAFFPPTTLDWLLLIVAGFVIYVLHRNSGTVVALVVCWLIAPPVFLFGLIAPNKETIVLMASLLIYFFSKKVKSRVFLYLFIFAIYALYASSVRFYYWAILFAFFGIWIALHFPKTALACGLILLPICMLLPGHYFEALQSPRDTAFIVSEYILQSGNRTSFTNLVEPNSFLNFLVNYIYAAAILTFPFLKYASANEVFLFLNISAYSILIFLSVENGNWKYFPLTILFLSHVLVLWLFEPDLGSFFRHFSSVVIYVAPALKLLRHRERPNYANLPV